ESLALSPDGRRLYVACSGINAVAILNLDGARPPADRIAGLIPTGWYPCQISLSPDARYLAIANALGVGSGSDPGKVARMIRNEGLHVAPGIDRRYVRADRGTVQ